MASVNKVILIGNLGADPELKHTTNNRAVCTLSLATNEVFKDKAGQRHERTEWHRVTVWGDTAENCSKYLAKGRSAYVEGRLQTRAWDDKDGKKRYSTDIIADRVVFLGTEAGRKSDEARSTEGDTAASDGSTGAGASPPSGPGDDNLPF
jgi:single-strand DNA-binding protein